VAKALEPSSGEVILKVEDADCQSSGTLWGLGIVSPPLRHPNKIPIL